MAIFVFVIVIVIVVVIVIVIVIEYCCCCCCCCCCYCYCFNCILHSIALNCIVCSIAPLCYNRTSGTPPFSSQLQHPFCSHVVEIYDKGTWFINQKFTFGVYLHFCSRPGINVKCPKSWNLDYFVSRMQWVPPRDLRFDGGHLGWRQEGLSLIHISEPTRPY